jgi:hypothetical protein
MAPFPPSIAVASLDSKVRSQALDWGDEYDNRLTKNCRYASDAFLRKSKTSQDTLCLFAAPTLQSRDLNWEKEQESPGIQLCFQTLSDLWEKGWGTLRPERVNLGWLV